MENVAQEETGMEDGRLMAEWSAFDALRAIDNALANDRVLGWLPSDVAADLERAKQALTRVFPVPDHSQDSLPF